MQYKTTPNYSSTEFYIYKLFSKGRGGLILIKGL